MGVGKKSLQWQKAGPRGRLKTGMSGGEKDESLQTKPSGNGENPGEKRAGTNWGTSRTVKSGGEKFSKEGQIWSGPKGGVPHAQHSFKMRWQWLKAKKKTSHRNWEKGRHERKGGLDQSIKHARTQPGKKKT